MESLPASDDPDGDPDAMRLSGLLATPAVGRLLTPAEPVRDGRVRHVLLAEDFDDLARSPADSLVVLTRHASLSLRGERFDAALRRAAEQGLVALVHDAAAPLSPAGEAIARHGGVTLLAARDGVGGGEVLLAVERELTGGAVAAVGRGARAVGDLREAEMLRAPDEELVKTVSAALGIEVSTSEHAQGGVSVPVRVRGHVPEWVSAAPAGEPFSQVSDLVLEALSAALARSAERRQRAESAPPRSAAQLVGDLLAADPSRDPGPAVRAKAAGLPVDGWHVVANLEIENLLPTAGGDELKAGGLLRDVASIALRRARSVHPDWHQTLATSGLTMVRMFRVDPGERAGALSAAVIGGAIARVRERYPQLRVRCGVGNLHPGAQGLAISYAEARTAIADARHSARVNVPVAFEPTGLRRALTDWLADSDSRHAVQGILAPLDVLGSRATEAVRTLQVYLDHAGSPAKTADLLHLHRNSVAYRLKRIFELLTVDPDDPEDRLLLQLACRAWLMK